MTTRVGSSALVVMGLALTGCLTETDVAAECAEQSIAALFCGTQHGATLDVGHCWIEPLRFDGRRWAVPFAMQMGWGGELPDNWKGMGRLEGLTGDRVRYVDRGGATLPLVPATDPQAGSPLEGCR